MNTITIIKNAKSEFVYKIITSIFIRGLLLIIPIFWTNAINHLTDGTYNKAYFLVIIALILSLLHYFWEYLNQKTWYMFYNKIYSGYITLIGEGNKDSIKKLSLGEYNNISNEDIDIICTFLGNLVTRIIQVLEFVVIYFYFLSIDIYIFLITIIVSIVLVAIFLMKGSGVQKLNQERKDSLDKKIIVVNDMYNTIKENKSNYDVLKKRFYARSNEYLRNNSNFNVIAQLIIYVVLSIIEISRYFLILYAIYLVYIGKMEIGTILLIYTYYSQILSNFEVMGTINVNYRSFLVSVSRLNRIKTEKAIKE